MQLLFFDWPVESKFYKIHTEIMNKTEQHVPL